MPRALNPECATTFTDIDLDAPGRQLGYFHIPHSPHEDAWGTVRIPIAVLAHGSGPTVILEGGNHGDEYEGQLVLGELVRHLDLARIRGRLIVIPAINTPASDAGRRTSPVDGKNLNRSFPGNHAGTITEQIAAYVSDQLLTRADALLSLHSGGSSLNIMTSTLMHPAGDTAASRRNLEAALAFGAPLVVVPNMLGDTRTLSGSAVEAGLACVTCEMAGMGTVTRSALALCRRGVLNVLAHWGVLEPERTQSPAQPGVLCRIADHRAYVIADQAGVFEPLHDLGEHVEAGESAGRIHFPTAPEREPAPLVYGASGFVYAQRQPAKVVPGNVCCVVASITDDATDAHLRGGVTNRPGAASP